MFSFLVSSLSMYMFTINQNMKVPFSLTKGSSLDLYAIVPGMSVIFSSTYNLNVTVSTKYSTLVYQTPQFDNETDSVHKNLKSVNFGSFTGRVRVVALEDTYFVYETVRGDFDKNESCVIKEENFTADQEMKMPPENQQPIDDHHNVHHSPHQPGEGQHQHYGDGNHQHFPPHQQKPGFGNHHSGDQNHQHFPPRQQPGEGQHQHSGDGNHQHFPPHHQPGHPQKPDRGNGRKDSNDYEDEHFDNVFDFIMFLIVTVGFIALGIALIVAVIRACKNNHCCDNNRNSINDVDDASIPPIVQQVDNFEQYIPPHRNNPVQQIPLNYPQLQPVQIYPAMAQSQQLAQPNYYYQQPLLIQQPIQNVGVFQGQPRPQ